jgi:hypothetical protein
MEVSGEIQAPAALPLGKVPAVPIGQEAGWASEPVWTLWRIKKPFSSPAGNRTPVVLRHWYKRIINACGPEAAARRCCLWQTSSASVRVWNSPRPAEIFRKFKMVANCLMSGLDGWHDMHTRGQWGKDWVWIRAKQRLPSPPPCHVRHEGRYWSGKQC